MQLPLSYNDKKSLLLLCAGLTIDFDSLICLCLLILPKKNLISPLSCLSCCRTPLDSRRDAGKFSPLLMFAGSAEEESYLTT